MSKNKALVIVFLIASVNYMKSQKKEKITINVTYKSHYCGGARPTPEMVAETEKSKPFANKMMVIVSEKYKVDSAKTNEKGELKIKIKKGIYFVYEAWKYYKIGPSNLALTNYDKGCLKAEWDRYTYRINKTDKKTSIEPAAEIIEICAWQSPCLLPGHAPQPPE